ncbi:unnamed protein product [Blepharisma stoltei]|uniref:Uncharacterized protein n=1 Tax=Blepharisma stoltei TaxID=1481888 RepID=A0AAU9KP28_9CILI|nr:unnamed protein product [Blepharisma stoltei]
MKGHSKIFVYESDTFDNNNFADLYWLLPINHQTKQLYSESTIANIVLAKTPLLSKNNTKKYISSCIKVIWKVSITKFQHLKLRIKYPIENKHNDVIESLSRR